jgi:tryptophanyl-tRNA synthetase
MTLQNRINELFTKFNLSLSTVEKTELMAEATLENGTIIFTDAEGFEDGAEVYIVNEEGEKIPLPDGDYTLEDGRTMTIADGGKISKSDEKVEELKEEIKEDVKEELAEDEEEKVEEVKEELMDDAHVIDLINRILDERFPAEIVEEEMSAEDKAVTELKALLEAQTEELTSLKSQAASEGVKRVTTTKVTPQVDLTSLSTEDRVKAIFNKYNS